MTKRDALEALLHCAAKRCTGAGRGLAETVSDVERAKVKAAVIKLWPYIYKYPCSDDALRNIGL